MGLEDSPRYAGTFIDTRFDSDGWLYLPHEVTRTLLERTSSMDIGVTVSVIYGSIKCLRLIDERSSYVMSCDEKSCAGSITLERATIELCKDDFRVKIPYSLTSQAKLDPARIFLAADEDGDTFTLWRNERWFQKAGSSCSPVDPGEQRNRTQADPYYRLLVGKDALEVLESEVAYRTALEEKYKKNS